MNCFRTTALWFLAVNLLVRPISAADVELFVDSSAPGDEIDMTRYALGQGGLSDFPMFDAHIDPLMQLQPRTIRLFVQEYFNLLPERGQFHWETLDQSIESILATGAKPILALCFKPRVLYPRIEQNIVHPVDYSQWAQLIFELVRHCNQERKFGIEYWEVGNEPDIGENGGCPYLFQPEDYITYYVQTTAAIRRADPKAKVGGPALAAYRSRIGDALIEHCAKRAAPLDFFSWHIYSNDPEQFRESIRDVKQRLAKYPQLAKTETILDEWNMSLASPNLRPEFQPAFVLQTSGVFYEEGLTRSAYYHIRDIFVDRSKFSPWMSAKGVDFMEHWWNTMPQYDGLWDNQGRLRPVYYSFKLLSLLQGQKLPVSGTTAHVRAIGALNRNWHHVVFWNFSADAAAAVTIRWPETPRGQFRLIKMNAWAAVNNLEVVRHGSARELASQPMKVQLEPYGVGWAELTIGN